MKNTIAFTAALASMLTAVTAWPCGIPFGAGINVDPRQDIIVVHKDGVETYVFQPTFCGTASNFGLILPVPSKLTEQPAVADAKIFTTVDALSQPQHIPQTLCRYRGPTDGSIATGGIDTNPPGTVVVASGRVGFLDWAQLKADSTASFTDWLDANGFPHQASTNTAFSYYVNKGWYFLAFKIAQQVTGSTVCNVLGPVKLSFTSDVPVVPSGIASAGAGSTGSGSYSSGFTWRIFGISGGASQISFVTASYQIRDLNYSGLLTASDVAQLGGLAVENDRLTKLSLWFGYGGTTEDVALSLQPAKDYRDIVYDTTYVDCLDAGTPADASPDTTAADSSPPIDLAPQQPTADGGASEAQTIPIADAGIASQDTTPSNPVLAADAGITRPDALPSNPIPAADAGTTRQDATPSNPMPSAAAGGACSIAPAGGSAGMVMPLLLGLALLWRIRRRNS